MTKIPDPKRMKRIKGPQINPKNEKNIKVRITTYVDQDVLSALRQTALESGSKYQALLNQILREGLLGEQRGLLARVSKLENAVFKQKPRPYKRNRIKRQVA